MEIFYRILNKDKELFLYINSKHKEWLDPIMLGLSSFEMWIIVCIIILGVMAYKNGHWRIVPPAAMLITIGLNSLINNLIKIIVARPRPLHIAEWNEFIHAIEEYDASYSFFSAHSSNSFSMAVFSLLYFRNKIYSCVILLWATAVAYSRIYVGKHFPIDVVCGIAFGVMMGIMCYKIFDSYRLKRLKP